MQVKIFHHLGFSGMHRGYKAGDLMRLVFEFDLPDAGEHSLEPIFKMFNIEETGIAAEYRAKQLRSLSVGDVVTFGDTESFAVDRWGWTRLDEPMTAPSPLAVQAHFALTIVPQHRLEALAGCRIVSRARIDLPEGSTPADARRIADVWDRLDTQQQDSLVGLQVDRVGDLSEI